MRRLLPVILAALAGCGGSDPAEGAPATLDSGVDTFVSLDVIGVDTASEHVGLDAMSEASSEADAEVGVDSAAEDADASGDAQLGDAPADADAGLGCAQGAWRCEGNALQFCDGSSWKTTSTCLPGLCDEAAHQCDSCAPSAVLGCLDAHTQTVCSADGQGSTVSPCPLSTPHCFGAGACVECLGAADCTNTNPCLSSACEGNACVSSPLTAGAACTAGKVCDGKGACVDCLLGQKKCVGSNAQTCDATGHWVTSTCQFVCSAGQCEGQCTPNATECESSTTLRTCNSSGTWVSSTCSASTPICAAGACIAPPPCPTKGGSMLRTVTGFCIDVLEVTRSAYASFLATGPFTSTSVCSWNQDFTPNATCMAQSGVCQGASCDSHPQVCVDWCDANAFCGAMGKRLCGKIGGGSTPTTQNADPDVSEWMDACSAGGLHAAPSGPCNTSSSTTSAVGSFPNCRLTDPGYASAWDMIGNVLEWENSCASSSGASDSCRIRGGAYYSGSTTCAGAGPAARSATYAGLGFRCCAD